MMDALGPNQTFRTVDGKPIYWRDKQDFIHACEGSDVHPGVTLIWTLCERDVPANTAYKCDGDTVTCATCKSRSAPYPFCRTPQKCAGKGYCPNEYACND